MHVDLFVGKSPKLILEEESPGMRTPASFRILFGTYLAECYIELLKKFKSLQENITKTLW
jgi:hypothetical protein